MNKYLAVFRSDMKSTFRDPSLIMILCVPLLIILILRFGFPFLLQYVPGAVDYRAEIVSSLTLIGSVLPGIIMSFILLDEKDVQLIPVIKATPVSLSGFMATRLFFMIVTGFVMSLLVLLLNGIYVIPAIQAMQVSLLAGLNSPILILLVSHFAKNKVEGLALIKVATVTLFIPVVIFFFDQPWEYALGIFPAFWFYAFFSAQNSFVIFLSGLFFLSVVNWLTFRLFLKNS